MNDIPDMEWIEGLSDSRAVEFIKIFRPDFRQSIKKIGNLRRFKGEANLFSCVYFLINDDGEVVYIGRTDNLLQRVGSHQKDKDFNKVYYIKPNIKTLEKKEALRVARMNKKHEKVLRVEGRNKKWDFLGNFQPNPIEYLCKEWIKETEKKYIEMYFPKYNRCAVAMSMKSSLEETYQWIGRNKKRFRKLEQFVS